MCTLFGDVRTDIVRIRANVRIGTKQKCTEKFINVQMCTLVYKCGY